MKKINKIFLFLHFIAILFYLWLLLITVPLHIIIYLYRKLTEVKKPNEQEPKQEEQEPKQKEQEPKQEEQADAKRKKSESTIDITSEQYISGCNEMRDSIVAMLVDKDTAGHHNLEEIKEFRRQWKERGFYVCMRDAKNYVDNLISEVRKEEIREERKNNLIEEYGVEDGMLIYSGKISEHHYYTKKKYGDKYGTSIIKNKIIVGMTKEMVIAVKGKPDFDDGQKYYYGRPFKKKMIFTGDKLKSVNGITDPFWIGMKKNMIIASLGTAKDEKKNVSKGKTKLKWYFGGRTTRQGTTAYKYEVRLENDLVVGWKELE